MTVTRGGGAGFGFGRAVGAGQNETQIRKYVEDQAEHEKAVKDGKTSQPPRKTVSDDLIRLVKKEVPLRTDAASVGQIRDMIRLAKELDYNLMLESAYESWLVADDIFNSNTPLPTAQ